MRTETFWWALALASSACGASPAPLPADPPAPPAASTPAVGPGRPGLTQAQCEAQGGAVVGDIGDGATSRPGYVCASGKPPLGGIAPAGGGPIAVEGSVCCPR